jgi:GNAT superfamily N-acetyltransferase
MNSWRRSVPSTVEPGPAAAPPAPARWDGRDVKHASVPLRCVRAGEVRCEELLYELKAGPAVTGTGLTVLKTWCPSRQHPCRPADQPQLRALHDRTPPDGSPPSTGTQAWIPDLDHIPETYLAFLVAVEEADEGERLIGMVGITAAGSDVPASVLQDRERVVQLQRLRVAPKRQRQGIGARLTEAAITWRRDHGHHALVVGDDPPTDRRRRAVPPCGLPRSRPLDGRAIRAGVVRRASPGRVTRATSGPHPGHSSPDRSGQHRSPGRPDPALAVSVKGRSRSRPARRPGGARLRSMHLDSFSEHRHVSCAAGS